MNEMIVGVVGIFVLLLLFATGIELGFAMGLVGFLGFAYLNGFQPAINLLARDFYEVITNYGYTVFPLFVLMGQIGFNAGIAVRLYDAANKFIGHVPGGLAMATVVGATGFKTICGSSAATAATFASDRWKPRLYHTSERCPHHIGDSHGTVHRPALSRRHRPWTDHRRVLYGYHLWMGQDQSSNCA
jgi:hypothetical protein